MVSFCSYSSSGTVLVTVRRRFSNSQGTLCYHRSMSCTSKSALIHVDIYSMPWLVYLGVFVYRLEWNVEDHDLQVSVVARILRTVDHLIYCDDVVVALGQHDAQQQGMILHTSNNAWCSLIVVNQYTLCLKNQRQLRKEQTTKAFGRTKVPAAKIQTNT